MRISRQFGVITIVAAAVLLGIYALSLMPIRSMSYTANPDDPGQVVLGERLYALHCAACHGARLEGQPNWRQRLSTGRLPAPPHDESGHTWHHPDRQLFDITKHGVAQFAPRGYESDMPAFDAVMSDIEIWAVLAFIKSRWPAEIRRRQAEISRQSAAIRLQKNGIEVGTVL